MIEDLKSRVFGFWGLRAMVCGVEDLGLRV